MLKKEKRLSRKEFDRFFSLGTRHHAKGAQLVYTNDNSQQFSVVVPKKVAKEATKRNTLRRQVYDMLQEVDEDGIFIFILKPAARTYSHEELKHDIFELVVKAAK